MAMWSRSAENVLAHYAKLSTIVVLIMHLQVENVCDDVRDFGCFSFTASAKRLWPKLRCTKGTFYQMHTTISVCVLNQMFSIHVDSVALLQIIVCLWTTIKSIAKHKSMRSMMHLNKRRIFYWSLKSDALCVCVCMYVKHIHKKRLCRHLQMVHMKEESHLLLIAKSNFRRGNSQRSNKVNWKCVRYTTIA